MFACVRKVIAPLSLAAAVVVAGTAPDFALSAERVMLKTRTAVTVPMYIAAARGAVATVILLPGGNGRLKVDRNANIGNDSNFLTRSRGRFEAAGYNVVLPDVPSDRDQGGLGDASDSSFRLSAKHMADLEAIVAYARDRFDKPVVIVGMSRGSISLAAFLTAKPGAADAAAFVSSVVSGGLDGSLHKVDLSAIAVPVLFVHHRKDACTASRPRALTKVVGKFRATRPELIWIDGHGTVSGRECGPYHYHGFQGQENEAVGAISGWFARTIR